MLTKTNKKCCVNIHSMILDLIWAIYLLLSYNFFNFFKTKEITLKLNKEFVKQKKHVFVSGFFPVDQIGVRHKLELYLLWIDRLIRYLDSELFFYTSKNFCASYLKKYSRISTFHVMTKYQTGFDVPFLQTKKKHYYDLFKKSKLSYKCTPEISGVWNAKMQFIYEVSLQNNKKWTFWIDAGYYRYQQFSKIIFPDQKRLRFIDSNISLIFISPVKFKLHKSNTLKWIQRDTVLGGFFGGNYEAVQELYRLFIFVHEYFLKKNVYVGREELIFSTILNFYNISCWIIPLFTRRNNNISKYFCAIPFLSSNDICDFPSNKFFPISSFT